MKQRKLSYRFHDYILKIFIEANTGKVEAAIQKAAETIPADEEPDRCERRSA